MNVVSVKTLWLMMMNKIPGARHLSVLFILFYLFYEILVIFFVFIKIVLHVRPGPFISVELLR